MYGKPRDDLNQGGRCVPPQRSPPALTGSVGCQHSQVSWKTLKTWKMTDLNLPDNT